MIEIKGLSTTFDNGKKIVHNNLNLKINKGERISLIGKNGVGKTVLAETIVGIREIQSGEIISDEGFDRTKDVGMQFQSEFGTQDMITPKNVISFFSKLNRKKIEHDEINELITLFGIKEFENTKFFKLSGGQKQRINLLLALMSKPKFLILDEFTTGLDITTVIDIMDYVLNYVTQNNVTLIVITHSSKEIKLLTEKVILMKDGVIKKEYNTSDIEKEYNGDFDQFLIDSISTGGKNNENK